MRGSATTKKKEKIDPAIPFLLVLTALFLAVLLVFSLREGPPSAERYTVTTERSAEKEPQALININTADAALLETLPGIGPALAQAIVAYRSEHGPFSSAEELLAVSGIGESKLSSIRGRILWEASPSDS